MNNLNIRNFTNSMSSNKNHSVDSKKQESKFSKNLEHDNIKVFEVNKANEKNNEIKEETKKNVISKKRDSVFSLKVSYYLLE